MKRIEAGFWVGSGRPVSRPAGQCTRVAQDSVARRRRLEEAMEERRGEEEGVICYRAIRRGWFLGEETLRKELLIQMGKGFGAHHGVGGTTGVNGAACRRADAGR